MILCYRKPACCAVSPWPTYMAASTGHVDMRGQPTLPPQRRRSANLSKPAEEPTKQPAHAVGQVLHGSNKLGIEIRRRPDGIPRMKQRTSGATGRS